MPSLHHPFWPWTWCVSAKQHPLKINVTQSFLFQLTHPLWSFCYFGHICSNDTKCLYVKERFEIWKRCLGNDDRIEDDSFTFANSGLWFLKNPVLVISPGEKQFATIPFGSRRCNSRVNNTLQSCNFLMDGTIGEFSWINETKGGYSNEWTDFGYQWTDLAVFVRLISIIGVSINHLKKWTVSLESF